jgi:two-component system sensor histidine kinase/response regulator
MSSDPSSTFSRILPAAVFQQIVLALEKTAQSTNEQIFTFTEADFCDRAHPSQDAIQCFFLVISRSFSALLTGEPTSLASESLAESTSTPTQVTTYRTQLTFAPAAIAPFLTHLQTQVASAGVVDKLKQAHRYLRPNQADCQSQFTLELVDILTSGSNLTSPLDCVLANLPAQDPDLLPDQEQVFTQVATQIRRTQELSLILETTLQQVCDYLKADRLIIYQFEPETSTPQTPPSTEQNGHLAHLVCGRITYEARANSSVPQVLHLSEGNQCFIGVPNYREKYRQGATQAVADIHTTYVQAPCLVEFLEWAQIRAKLVVPIVVQEDLWGLLIAHQCSGPRQWQDSETRFMRCIAELMAIAIYQTQLYGHLQQQAQTLEQRVIERTQALHDTLTAAQTASLAKTEFLAAMSHELRTPLTAIIGMATTLLRVPTDARRDRLLSPEKQQEYLKIIRNSGEHLLELINDILDLSQLEAGRTILDVREFSLFQVASESLHTLKEKAEQNRIHLELDLKLTSQANGEKKLQSDRFTADPRRVKQILLNLLSNAIKFTPEGGQVTLRVWVDRNKAGLQVEDTGIGIPRNKFPLLFQKFQQLDTSYHRQYEGTGLGLALTKQLVELHGGQIEVESTVNVGSTFTVLLPAQPLTSRRGDPKPSELPEFQRAEKRIILIEKYEAIAHLLCDLLTAAGHQVIWMIDGMTALQQIEILKPEVVIVSTQLTGMGTSEILQRLRQENLRQPFKIFVLTTANDSDMECHQWQAEGADDCIPLPIVHPEEVLDKVH